MANRIILKKSSEPSKVPTAGDLQYGELALNFADGVLYYKNAANEVAAFTGPTGPTGDIGPTGPTGDIGPTGPAGLDPWTLITANYTAQSNNRLIADTSGGAFTITLPPTPTLGDYIIITDGADFNTTNLTIARNGSTIEGIADDVLIDLGGCTYEFIYGTDTWQLTTTTGTQGATGSVGPTGAIGPTGPPQDLAIAGDVFTGALQYNGLDAEAGTLYGGTVNPTNTTRLNYDGALHATSFVAPQLTSIIATGTAPLTVASSTMVDNLNVERVGGATYQTITDNSIAYAIALG